MGQKLLKSDRLHHFLFIWRIAPQSFLEMILWGLVNCAVSVMSVWATRQVLSLFTGGFSGKLFSALALYGLLLLLSSCYSFYYKRYRVQFHVILDFEREMRSSLFRKNRSLSNETYERESAIRMIRMADGAKQNLFRYVEIWISIAIAIFQAIVVTIYISTFNIWFFLLLPFAMIPPCLTLVYQSNLWKRYYKTMEQCKREESEYGKAMIDEVACKESRVTYASILLTQKWEQTRNYRDAVENEKSKKMFLLRLLVIPLDLLGSYGGYLVAAALLCAGNIDYASAAAAIAAYASLMSAFSSLASMIGNEGQYYKMIQPFFDFWNLPERNGTKIPCRPFQEIQLRHVSFSYPGQETRALDDINLTISKGEVIALVGANGAGKTTLANVILGLFMPNEGTVCFNGENISGISESMIHQKQSLVSQVFNRYKMSVRDNIAIGDFEKNDTGEIEQKKTAFLDDPAISLDTLLGKEFGGRELSGGQWQQLSCARGFYKDSDFLVLDEATSAIDPLKEKAMYDSFQKELKGRTGILITHRLGAVSLADRIIVLEHGHIVQQGTHNQLLCEDGPYLQLWNLQTRAF